MRREFLIGSFIVVVVTFAIGYFWPPFNWLFIVIIPFLALGYQDYFQKKQTIRRNFPIFGRFRYLFEAIRPEINQYFVESNSDGVPFSREQRSLVYQRAKNVLDTLPFGTQKNTYDVGYEWINHSVIASDVQAESLRLDVGGPDCKKPYNASIFNVAGMSYGALSSNAVESLVQGAKIGGFAVNTGEGGLSRCHLEGRGDLIWQIGTGYFSCRTPDGNFCEKSFENKSQSESVKMVEIKISQGAKPGLGGILPAKKITPEIAAIRGIPMGADVISPPSHKAFKTPIELMEFIKRLRELSGGKPIGFKICIGKRREFLSICKAMEKTGITPDFIAIDGGEGGTGAAPLEFSNHVGSPGVEGLIFAHNALVGFGMRERIRVMATGKITTGFGVIKRLALGADMAYSARAFMLALGCIQALRCNSNHCPAGVATQDPHLTAGLVVTDKKVRVATYHAGTMESVADMLSAMGLDGHSELRPWHVMRRVSSTEIKHYGEVFDFIEPGSLTKSPLPKDYERAMKIATAESFRAV